MNWFKKYFSTLLFLASIILFTIGFLTINASKITINWSSKSEFGVIGYNVLRTENNSDYRQINDKIVPSSGDPFTGGNYQFTDKNVTPGKEYLYMIEEVKNSGTGDRIGPIKVKAISQGKYYLFSAVITLLFGFSIHKIIRKNSFARNSS